MFRRRIFFFLWSALSFISSVRVTNPDWSINRSKEIDCESPYNNEIIVGDGLPEKTSTQNKDERSLALLVTTMESSSNNNSNVNGNGSLNGKETATVVAKATKREGEGKADGDGDIRLAFAIRRSYKKRRFHLNFPWLSLNMDRL